MTRPPESTLPARATLAALAALAESGPRPLFATLSGSHLYGFPSPDSDYDLRGAFVAPLRRSLGIEAYAETEVREDPAFALEGLGLIELDWVAHEIGKYARLLGRADGVALEQVFSPLEVIGGPWLDELRALAAGCVCQRIAHHYRGFLRGKRRDLIKVPTVKGLLYAYRVGLSGVEALTSGAVESNLLVLAERYPALAPPDLAELIARKRSGPERRALRGDEFASHSAGLDRLEAALEAALESSPLPEAPTTRAALSDYVVRARLALGGAR